MWEFFSQVCLLQAHKYSIFLSYLKKSTKKNVRLNFSTQCQGQLQAIVLKQFFVG